SIPIALERPSGLVVDTLLDAGHPVVPIHPNALKASRPRYSAAGGKSDPGDAFILGDLLRTDGHRFRPLQPLADDTRALRALVRPPPGPRAPRAVALGASLADGRARGGSQRGDRPRARGRAAPARGPDPAALGGHCRCPAAALRRPPPAIPAAQW